MASGFSATARRAGTVARRPAAVAGRMAGSSGRRTTAKPPLARPAAPARFPGPPPGPEGTECGRRKFEKGPCDPGQACDGVQPGCPEVDANAGCDADVPGEVRGKKVEVDCKAPASDSEDVILPGESEPYGAEEHHLPAVIA